jgi:plastocyanin
MIAAALACLLGGGAARSAPPEAGAPKGRARAGGRGPTAAEFEALKQRVDQQNAMIVNLTEMEAKHYNQVIMLLESLRPGAARSIQPLSAPPPPPPAGAGSVAPPSPPPTATDQDGAGARSRFASITGRVEVKGRPRGPIYVYVDNIKETAVDRRIEIVQKDRAFVPDVVIAQRGTQVSFPNADPWLHNVFSPSPTQPFDLGSYKQGEKAGVVKLYKPGVVEVFCNMHARMRADVLVVPNHHYARANPDGSFRLDGVPVGARQVSAWTPDARIVSEPVNLTAAGASVKFTLQAEPHAHPKKTGEVYEPYDQN